MIPQEIFGKYLQTLSSYSVFKFSISLILMIILIITSFIRKNCTSAIACGKFQIITMKRLDDIHLQMLKLPIQKSVTAKV